MSIVDLLRSQFLVSSFGFKGHTGLLGNEQVDTDSATGSNQFGYRMLNISLEIILMVFYCIVFITQNILDLFDNNGILLKKKQWFLCWSTKVTTLHQNMKK